MNKQPTTKNVNVQAIEQVLIKGDLSDLTADQRLSYYKAVCESVGLNPLTKPFEFLKLNNKIVLYALKGATDQLRSLHGISIGAPLIQYIDDIVFVSVTASDKTGRTDADTGAVTVGRLQGDAKCNAVMKAITKAKRRVTLSLCGLGMLDETEIETIPDARPVPVDPVGMPEPEAQPEQGVEYWYSFASLDADKQKMAVAMAVKQKAIQIDHALGTFYTTAKPLVPRKNFDKFLCDEELNCYGA